MALVVKAAIAMHWFGVQYAADDVIDTTGYDDRAMTQLLTTQPVYVSDTSGGSTPPSSMTLNGGGGAYGATYASVTFSDNSDPAPVGTDIVWDGVDTVTIATAGTYAVSWYADGSTTAGGSAEVWAKVSRNNDALGPFYYHETHKVIPASSDFDIDGSVTTPLAANDTLKLMVRATSGGANGPANGALTVTRVG